MQITIGGKKTLPPKNTKYGYNLEKKNSERYKKYKNGYKKGHQRNEAELEEKSSTDPFL